MAKALRILVVEDDPVSEYLFKDHLPKGVDFQFSTSPHKAAEWLQSEHFDFLICSLYMPRVSGLELGAWAKQNNPKLQLIILTSRHSPLEQTKAKSLGASHIVKKPIDFKELNHLFQGRSQGVQGHFRQVSLTDLLQVVSMNNKGLRLFELTSPDSNFKGYIYLQDQEVIHSEYRSLTDGSRLEGEGAFIKLLSFSNASLSEVEWVGEDDYERTIHLPLQSLLAQATKALDENTETGVIQQLKKILIVEDDLLILDMLSRFLGTQNYDVCTAESAILGAKLMKEQHFDLVVTDINMPEITGVVFLSWIKTNFPLCPVIIMTAFHDPELEQASRQLGCLKFMQKPFSLKQFHKYLTSLTSQGVEGKIQYIQILDLIQLELLARNQKCLKITDLKTQVVARIYINLGRIIHAEYGEVIGEEAFNKIAQIQKGVFDEEVWREPEQESLKETPPHRLLLGVGQNMDEVELKIDPKIIARIEKKLHI